jgi:hypothetical protein
MIFLFFLTVCNTSLLTLICLRATTLSYDVAHRTVRSWRQNSFVCFSRWPWNTLHNRMCGVACCRKEWGGSFQQYFYNRYKIVVYTGLRSDSIKNHASRNEARRTTATHILFTRISCTLLTFICLKGYYIIVWRCVPHRQIVTSELVWLLSHWPWNTLRNYMWCRLLQEGVGEALYDEAHGARIVGEGVGKQWTEKESVQQYFYNRYKILHTCHTYCCYAYHFYAYWLYFIFVWHVYVSPKTYKWFGTFIIKYGRYTFTFDICFSNIMAVKPKHVAVN